MYANLEINNTLYVFMHAEQVFHGIESYDTCSIIGGSTIEDIYKYIFSSGISSIVIDFDKIKKEKNGVLWMEKIIQHCKNSNINLTLCRIEEGLFDELKLGEVLKQYYEGDYRKKSNGNGTSNCICSDSTVYDINDEIIDKLYEDKLIERMIDSTSNYIDDRSDMKERQYSHSSNVNLPKYINIKAFIEEKEMSFLGLYLLFKKAKKLNLFTNKNNQPLLFFSSMAGSYLASIFSKLAGIDMVFLNHLGPKKKLYREFHKEQLLADRDYLIISDVICLGAEIERAKTLIEYAGGNLKGILSVVLVEVVSEPYPIENSIKKAALLTLKKGFNPIDYEIITDFPEIKK